MSMNLQVTGFREIERALAALPRATSKRVARRALREELKRVASMANALWPGSSDDVFRISPILARARDVDFRDRGASIVRMYVGATGGRTGTPHAHLVEFGTGPRFQKNGRYTGVMPPQPMLQPAWDAHKGRILRGLGDRIWSEIARELMKQAARRGG